MTKGKNEPIGAWTLANPHEKSYVCELCDAKGQRIRGQVFPNDQESALRWAREQVKRNSRLKRRGRTIKVVKIETRTIFAEQI